ncbi:hypothetical protein GTP45_01130 [Pseudoduganella sp. FT55W]|uniref:Uncharacterized protein n=1 Tax=Duganella rivi TaxID=2666083 RepID=A0A7X4GLU9_9BURK|nr:hypothetical protein [Duganella rivi]MYM65435.1 hypothetical protein [Duganella rivi]
MFELVEARINSAAMKKLSNATALINGEGVRVIFDAEYKVGMVGVVGIGASEPQMVIANEDVPLDFIGMELSINGAIWSVVDRHPDGQALAGLSVVVLEKR